MGVSLVTLTCLRPLRRLRQGVNDFSEVTAAGWPQSPGVVLGAVQRHCPPACSRVPKAPATALGTEQATGGRWCRPLIGGKTLSPCPALPRAWSAQSARVSAAHSEPTFSVSERPHLTANGEQAGAEA